MEWRVVFTKDSYRQYQGLKSGYRKAIRRQLLKLVEQKNADIKHIEGHENIYRIRLGKYRAILRLDFNKKEIFIINIKKRSSIYKKF